MPLNLTEWRTKNRCDSGEIEGTIAEGQENCNKSISQCRSEMKRPRKTDRARQCVCCMFSFLFGQVKTGSSQQSAGDNNVRHILVHVFGKMFTKHTTASVLPQFKPNQNALSSIWPRCSMVLLWWGVGNGLQKSRKHKFLEKNNTKIGTRNS